MRIRAFLPLLLIFSPALAVEGAVGHPDGKPALPVAGYYGRIPEQLLSREASLARIEYGDGRGPADVLLKRKSDNPTQAQPLPPIREVQPAAYWSDGPVRQYLPETLPGWVWPLVSIEAGLILLGTILVTCFVRSNRRLKREIERRRAVEAELRGSEESYRRLAEESKDVIWTIDLEQLRFTYISPSVQQVRGFTAEEVMAAPLEAAMTPESFIRFGAIIDEHLHRLAVGDCGALSAMTEIEQPHKNGHLIATEVVTSFLLDDHKQPLSILGVARDISERRAVEGQLRAANDTLRNQLEEIQRLQGALEEQAVRDSLTGCFNRRYFDETLERELSRARREGYPLSLLMFDLDHFKQINDSFGHQAGDQALKELSRTLLADIRHEDVLCRYGGEEFVVLMPRMPLEIAEHRAEYWRQMIGALCVRTGTVEIGFTASIGLAGFPLHGSMPDELTRAADLALYVAKRQGRNRVVVYNDTVDRQPRSILTAARLSAANA